MRVIARFIMVAIVLASIPMVLDGCMSADELAQRVKAAKEKLDAAKAETRMVNVVFAKKNLTEGQVISNDDIEMKEANSATVPSDACYTSSAVDLHKAKKNISQGEIVCQHDLAPLVK